MKSSQIQKITRSALTFTQDIHQAAQIVKMALGLKDMHISSEFTTDHSEFFVASGNGQGFEVAIIQTNNGDDTFKFSYQIQTQ